MSTGLPRGIRGLPLKIAVLTVLIAACLCCTLPVLAIEGGASASTGSVGGAGTDAGRQVSQFERQRLNLDDDAGSVAGRDGYVPGVWDIFKMLLFVALIVGLIYALAYFLKFVAGSRRLFHGSSAARVLHTLPLGGKQSIVAVKLGGRILIVGVSGDGVRRLSEVTDPEEVTSLTRELAAPAPAESAFGRLLRGGLSRGGEDVEEIESDESEDGGGDADDRSVFSRARNELEGIRRTIDHWRSDRSDPGDREDRR